jgi:hypothetical protein
MTRIKMLGLMMVAVSALSAVAASTASALQWLDNGTPILSPILVLSTETLLFWDLASPGGGTAVICKGDNHGTVGPGARDLILSFPFRDPCSFEKAGGCEAGSPPNWVAVHLPWVTRLLTVAGVTRDMLEPSGAGNPGWAVTCKTIIGNVTDECTSATGEPKVTNNSSGDVTETFDAFEPGASCTQGNATSGMVIGPVLVFAEKPLLKISTG